MELRAAVSNLALHGDSGSFQRSCNGKIPYDTEKAAKREAKFMHKKRHKPFNVYHCHFCPYFHIGTRRSQEAAIRHSLSHPRATGDNSDE